MWPYFLVRSMVTYDKFDCMQTLEMKFGLNPTPLKIIETLSDNPYKTEEALLNVGTCEQ